MFVNFRDLQHTNRLMSSLDATEAGLLAMLNDEQLGIYMAHKGQASWMSKMEDILTVKQHKVFEKVYEETMKTSSSSFSTNVTVPNSIVPRVQEYLRNNQPNVQVHVTSAEKNSVMELGGESEAALEVLLREFWKFLESTFAPTAVIPLDEPEWFDVIDMCAKWTEQQKFEFQSNSFVSVLVNHNSGGDRTLIIRGWDRVKCDNAKCKLRSKVSGNNKGPKKDQLQGAAPIPTPRKAVPVEKLMQQMQLEDDDLDNYPDVMNILMLGESGAGKSTFINSFVNYLKFSSMEHASQKGPIVLIRSMFNANAKNIICEPTIQSEQTATNTKYEVLEQGQSATQEPQSYVFSYNWKGKEKIIRIIDTPGVDDTRGLEICKENFNKILSFIADYESIHAVCILLKANQARLTPAFKYCIQELLVHLHKSASTNILFCFTHTQGSMNKVGDTPTTVRKVLEDLKAKRGIQITMNRDTMFCFDGESFRYLAQNSKGLTFTAHEVQTFQESWNRSAKETLRLLERITTLPPHDVNETLCLNNTRRLIELLCKPLAEIAASIMQNEELVKRKSKYVERLMVEGASLNGQLFVQQEVLTTQDIPYPKTVCANKACTTYHKVNGVNQVVFDQECHAHCFLQGVQVKTIKNPILRYCWAMNGTDRCRCCEHSWEEHMHIRYEIVKELARIESKTVNDRLKTGEEELDAGRKFLQELYSRNSELKRQKEKITNYCAVFASFLEKNSIVVYNDGFKEYIQLLIKEEKIKVTLGQPDDQLLELQRYAADYEEQAKLIREAAQLNGARQVTVEEINQNIQQLMKMDTYGTFLQDIWRVEMLVAGTTTQNLSQKIELRGWKKTLQVNY